MKNEGGILEAIAFLLSVPFGVGGAALHYTVDHARKEARSRREIQAEKSVAPEVPKTRKLMADRILTYLAVHGADTTHGIRFKISRPTCTHDRGGYTVYRESAMTSGVKTTSGRKKPLFPQGMILNGKWEILEHLATGGKGEVYRAHQTNLDREVVVKTVSLEYLAEFADDPEEIETELQRFHREALAMAQVRHPYVVQVYDEDSTKIAKDGLTRTVHYVVMEYVPGPTLRSTMPVEGFKTNEREARAWIRNYFLPVLDGIEPIHQLGIIHRDIKPENVLLDGTTPKITDFGIAGGRAWPGLTKSHHVEGTILYMAPDQFTDLAETDARADIYALGKILYEVMCGKMVDTKTACPLRSVCLADTPTPFLKGLDLIIQQATVEDKDERTPSVNELREQLLKLLEEAEAAERPLLKGLVRKQKTFLIVALLVLIAVIVASNIFHHYYMIDEMSGSPDMASHSPQHASGEGNLPPRAAPPQEQPPQSEVVAKDGSVMHLVPGGEVQPSEYLGMDVRKPVEVPSFYMNESEVTNFRYVEFLNQVLPNITVKNGIVSGEGHPWLLLGPVFGGFEPIAYENGRFLLKDASLAMYPVVRVTAYGASAYADFYGLHLPTEFEWLHAAQRPSVLPEAPPENRSHPAQKQDLEQEMEGWISGYASENTIPEAASPIKSLSRVPYPVTRFPPNADGIRGLEANISEWGVRKVLEPPGSSPRYVILGAPRGSLLLGSTPIAGVAQEPSGAFVDVGFRCVLEAGGHEK